MKHCRDEPRAMLKYFLYTIRMKASEILLALKSDSGVLSTPPKKATTQEEIAKAVGVIEHAITRRRKFGSEPVYSYPFIATEWDAAEAALESLRSAHLAKS